MIGRRSHELREDTRQLEDVLPALEAAEVEHEWAVRGQPVPTADAVLGIRGSRRRRESNPGPDDVQLLARDADVAIAAGEVASDNDERVGTAFEAPLQEAEELTLP